MSQDTHCLNGRDHSKWISRRRFLGYSTLVALSAALEPVARFVVEQGWGKVANADGLDPLTRDTMKGLVAFVVPGPDEYSVHQGVSTPEPGGIDADIIEHLIEGIDQFQPVPSFSTIVATVLNNIALAIHPAPPGPFPSAFSRLSFQEKVGVFAYMEATPELHALASSLPVSAGFLSYSEAGVFDRETRTLTGEPVGWILTGYEFAHGHDEFKGYYQNRSRVAQSDITTTTTGGGNDHA